MMPGSAATSQSTLNRVIHVCVDARALSTGHAHRGIGTYVATLVASLASLLSPNGTASDIHLHYLRADGDISALCQAQWHVYHATTLEGIILSPSFRTMATLYDLIPLRMPDWGRRVRHPLAAVAYQRRLNMVKHADHVIAISEATKRDAQELLAISAERITVVPPALDPARGYVPSREQMAAARAELGLQDPYFLAVASSEPHKNLGRVIEAFATFRARVPRAKAYRLYLVGTWMGNEERHVRSLIARLHLSSVVHHLPWVPVAHMGPLYHGATALVFPSLVEGFGLPVLEAMASGTPVITSNRSSLPEVAGDVAVYVNPEDVGEIGAALDQVASAPELRAELAARGLERSRQFGGERVARQLVSVYRQVAGGNRTCVQ